MNTFGWVFNDEVQAEVTNTIAESVRNNQAISYQIEAGDALGFPVSAEVRCDDTAFCQLVPHFEPNG